MLLYFGANGWVTGEGKIDAEGDTTGAVRTISAHLREAMAVSVDSNGNGVSYRIPVKDVSGNYVVPAVWDGITRRIELRGTTLYLTEGGSERTLCRGVSAYDPLSSGGAGTYRLFTAGGGAIIRQVTVQLVKSAEGARGYTQKGRRRETIYLRNIPELRG